IEEIKANRIDAAIVEKTVAQGYTGSNPNLEFHIIPNAEKLGFAIAFPKGSKLVARFNQVLQQMKDNGEMGRLTKKWLDTYGSKNCFAIPTE
ncbi:MAG: transporter substrate-binding domain-containing protein, partial [Calothrix sp. SM1_7_51]|nr:transporter substrate-binding domain-containing protein [Calothrix sp. SM1_7_51]